MTNIKKFLSLIAFSEGTSCHSLTKNDGYDVIVQGVGKLPEIFSNYTRHPFESRAPQVVRLVPLLTSTASGRYQILLHIYRSYKHSLHLTDFSPYAQDCIAVEMIKERGALEMIESDYIAGAINLCSNLWASFPGNNYGQGGHSIEVLLGQYKKLSEIPPQSIV